MSRPDFPAPARFLALAATCALPALLLAACATPNEYPSLAMRDVETAMSARPASPDPEPTPTLPAVDADLTTRLEGLMAVATDADERFAQKRASATRTIAAAGARGSDSWSAAQVALSELQTSRSQAMTALADLDTLYFEARDAAPNELSPRAKAIEATRSDVSGLIARQDEVLATLSAKLGA